MIIERAQHPIWLSNAFLVAEGEGGHGVLIDSNGVEDPLLDRIDASSITISHLLVTHRHPDHVVRVAELAGRLGVPVLAHALAQDVPGVTGVLADGDVVRSGTLAIEAIAVPGHCPDQLALLVNGTDCFTADCLFAGTVGGTMGGGPTGYADQVRSIMERLLTLPGETRIHPGHCHMTTVADELEHNPFVRLWRGVDAPGDEACTVRGEPATLLLFGPDYDGTHKARVRFADGREAIVGGSQVVRES
jgi:glyoxylase-like metal-dependent hydrolase (beta-lactamase superfamily II)